MEGMLKSFLSMLPEQLLKMPVGENISRALKSFEEMQHHLCMVSEKKKEGDAVYIKIATVMTFSLLKKIKDGKKITKMTADDWKSVADDINEYAIYRDNQMYVVFVFGMYERYIRSSAEYISEYVSENNVKAITALADEIKQKTEHLESGNISEVRYIEDCLWISLEAMIKLITSLAVCITNDEFAEYSQALAICAFEYGRYILYKRECDVLNEYIGAQKVLDTELREKYETYMDELTRQADSFLSLIDNAFAPDFRERFLNSVLLAQAAGVASDEILTDIDDIDDFFSD